MRCWFNQIATGHGTTMNGQWNALQPFKSLEYETSARLCRTNADMQSGFLNCTSLMAPVTGSLHVPLRGMLPL